MKMRKVLLPVLMSFASVIVYWITKSTNILELCASMMALLAITSLWKEYFNLPPRSEGAIEVLNPEKYHISGAFGIGACILSILKSLILIAS